MVDQPRLALRMALYHNAVILFHYWSVSFLYIYIISDFHEKVKFYNGSPSETLTRTFGLEDQFSIQLK